MPRPSAILRLLAFTVPVFLAVSGAQPLLAATVGRVPLGWALSVAIPAIGAAALLFLFGRAVDPGDVRQPPWYSAWILLPGSFALAGAASMCLIGSLTAFAPARPVCWALLGVGVATWSTGLIWVRRAST